MRFLPPLFSSPFFFLLSVSVVGLSVYCFSVAGRRRRRRSDAQRESASDIRSPIPQIQAFLFPRTPGRKKKKIGRRGGERKREEEVKPAVEPTPLPPPSPNPIGRAPSAADSLPGITFLVCPSLPSSLFAGATFPLMPPLARTITSSSSSSPSPARHVAPKRWKNVPLSTHFSLSLSLSLLPLCGRGAKVTDAGEKRANCPLPPPSLPPSLPGKT